MLGNRPFDGYVKKVAITYSWEALTKAYGLSKERSLPSKHINTGMGFERLVFILQDKRWNCSNDVFIPLFAKIQELRVRAHTLASSATRT